MLCRAADRTRFLTESVGGRGPASRGRSVRGRWGMPRRVRAGGSPESRPVHPFQPAGLRPWCPPVMVSTTPCAFVERLTASQLLTADQVAAARAAAGDDEKALVA